MMDGKREEENELREMWAVNPHTQTVHLALLEELKRATRDLHGAARKSTDPQVRAEYGRIESLNKCLEHFKQREKRDDEVTEP